MKTKINNWTLKDSIQISCSIILILIGLLGFIQKDVIMKTINLFWNNIEITLIIIGVVWILILILYNRYKNARSKFIQYLNEQIEIINHNTSLTDEFKREVASHHPEDEVKRKLKGNHFTFNQLSKYEPDNPK